MGTQWSKRWQDHRLGTSAGCVRLSPLCTHRVLCCLQLLQRSPYASDLFADPERGQLWIEAEEAAAYGQQHHIIANALGFWGIGGKPQQPCRPVLHQLMGVRSMPLDEVCVADELCVEYFSLDTSRVVWPVYGHLTILLGCGLPQCLACRVKQRMISHLISLHLATAHMCW